MTAKANPGRRGGGFTGGMAGLTAANLVTKALGFVRDALFVAVFGGGALADVYYAAFRLVNVFRRTAGEGAINAVVIPRLEEEKSVGTDAEAGFFPSAWTVMLLFSCLLAAAGILFRGQFALLSAWGFRADPEKFALAALLTAVLMPHLLFANLAALFTAALNSARRFFLPALAPAAFSVTVIALLLAFRHGFLAAQSGRGRILVLAATASASGLLQALLLLPQLRKAGFRLKLANPFSRLSTARTLLAAAPAAVTLAQDQISMLIDTLFASFLAAGSITAIYNSARLVQFPVSLFATAAATASMPELADRTAAGDMPGYRDHLRDALAASWLIMLPAAAGLAVVALPVCRALFEHGRFSPAASEMTAGALFWLAIGLPAYGFNKVAASSLYAMGRQRGPMAIAAAQLALNAVLCLALMGPMGVGGLMLATSLSSWAAAIVFLLELRRHSGFSLLSGIPLLRPALAAAAGTLTAFLLRRSLTSCGPLAVTAAAVPAAAAVYFIGLRLLKVEERGLLTGGRF